MSDLSNHETDQKQNINLRKNHLSRILIYSSALILAVYLISIGIAPLHKIGEIKKMVEADTVFIHQYDSINDHPEIISAIRKKVYTAALLKLSEMDSIQLIVNLHDSLVCLSINGVQIHKTPIQSIENDKLLKMIPNREYLNLFSGPIQIVGQNSTIVKEPIVVRQAPKDTIEASLNAYKPDTMIQNPAFLSLQLEHGLKLIFEQDIDSYPGAKKARRIFRIKLWLDKTIQSLINFVSLKKQEYIPTLVIKMPPDDLRAIYRALPANAFVVIYYD
ncbi:MAG: hypothetical protein K9H64_03640 [Bacteroidales bacterium]|nr:hypothetical protein [Bacteroidales bacterium]MCF8457388.1 hypothetical protein [Bacteroidales bacterium]